MIKIKRIILLLLFSVTLFAQIPVRIASYNLYNYDTNDQSRDASFKKILSVIHPDALIVVELQSDGAVTQFLQNCLNSSYKAVTTESIGVNYYNDCAFYYKDSVFTLINKKYINTHATRDISEFTLIHKFTNDTLIIFGAHLKAYPDSESAGKRETQTKYLRYETNTISTNRNYLICGDFNIYTSTETAFQNLVGNTTSKGYFIDPMNGTGSFSGNNAIKDLCTWSTRTNLNTRFDMFLVSPAIMATGGVDYKEFKIFGNDGNHYYSNMTTMPNTWFNNDPSIGTALYSASDHLPVYVDLNFGVAPVGVEEVKGLPKQYELRQNYPNPFNPSTEISYTIPSNSMVNIKVYDLTGREITTLVNEVKSAGTYKVKFDAGNLPSGIYLYSLQANGNMQMKKMILLK